MHSGKFLWVLLCACLMGAALPSTCADYDHSPTVGPVKGSLVIVGGGSLPPEITKRFVSLAGGPEANFVLIPTAQANFSEQDELKAFSRRFGVSHVTLLHTKDRSRADSSEFVGPLRHASGVWIEGGRQWRLADAYLGTSVEREIKALLARGGVVGGSSAGATIQGSYLVRGASGDAKDPDGDNTIMMAKGHEVGFGLLPNSAIDQHVIARHRENDLNSVMAAHPGLLGLGIDESTAVVVHGDEFEVIGLSKVLVHDGKPHGDREYSILSAGQKFNLKQRAVE
ncbi:MAG TPA: cyanophycinase [Candidatus Saccharimonadales bacterium]|jgi:cyanophycinase|nr:cyanophycinase [Candidatus Saccharimonadales bacterium]